MADNTIPAAMANGRVSKAVLSLTYADGRTESKTVTIPDDAWRPSRSASGDITGIYADVDEGYGNKRFPLWCLDAPQGYLGGFRMTFGVKPVKSSGPQAASKFTIA